MGWLDRIRPGKGQADPPDAAAATAGANALRLIAEGNACEDQGRLPEALARYDEAIRVAPSLARAHLNRGNALLALGDAQGAVDAYTTALGNDPGYAAAHYNLGNAYASLDRRDDAVAAYRQALVLKPDFADAEVAQGALQAVAGHVDDALASYRRALSIDPGHAAAHGNLANILRDQGRFDEAIAGYRRALERAPGMAMAQYGLGTALQGSGRFEEAAAAYRLVLQATPDFALAHGNLGSALRALGRNEEAIASYRQALRLAPELTEVHYDLGNLLKDLGRTREAAECYRQVLRLDPEHARAHCQMGYLLLVEGRLDAALAANRRALEIEPYNVIAHNNMAEAYRDLGLMDEALASYRQALDIEPDNAVVRSNLLGTQNFIARLGPEELLADAVRFGELAARRAHPFTTWPNAPDPGRALRIGVVSGDLRSHPVGHFLEGVLAALTDKAARRLEFHAYSNCDVHDAVSARIAASCRSWCPAAGLSDEALAQRIRSDGIDILLDLSGHTAFNRLTTFAWKPAPVQATWLGYFATTGVAAIDYLIADPWTLPASEEGNFTERIWRLPETRLCFTPPEVDVPVAPLPAAGNGHVTFGCFNRVAKLNDNVLALWARVLARVPGSRLLLKSRPFVDASFRQRTIERFARHAVPAERLLLEADEPREAYLAAHRRVDIALDPFPFTGGTTTVEALWMGVPVLTLAGTSFLARQGVGLLMNAGLPDWIAADADDYVARVVSHAGDPAALAALRGRLRGQVRASPVFDAPRFAGHLEDALRGMWQAWCARAGRPA